MPDLRPVFFVVGLMIAALGAAMFAPMIVDYLSEDRSWRTFGTRGLSFNRFKLDCALRIRGSTLFDGPA